jgi:hypothetical protein
VCVCVCVRVCDGLSLCPFVLGLWTCLLRVLCADWSLVDEIVVCAFASRVLGWSRYSTLGDKETNLYLGLKVCSPCLSAILCFASVGRF